MIIRIELDDGSEILMTAEQLAQEFLRLLQTMRAPEPDPERCQHCQYGRTPAGYCTFCQLGHDLKLVEARMPNPVGGLEGHGDEDA